MRPDFVATKLDIRAHRGKHEPANSDRTSVEGYRAVKFQSAGSIRVSALGRYSTTTFPTRMMR